MRGKETGPIKVRIIGFAKLIGELIEGLAKVMAVLRRRRADRGRDSLPLHALHPQHAARDRVLADRRRLAARPRIRVWASSSIRSRSSYRSSCSPIGVSHGAQKMNGIMQDIGRGTHRTVAARYTSRRLFLAGMTALLADAVGFAVLVVIDIPVIKDLALTASVGVAVLIFTNLILLPVLLSYTGVSSSAAQRSLAEERDETRGRGLGRLWKLPGPLHRAAVREWPQSRFRRRSPLRDSP